MQSHLIRYFRDCYREDNQGKSFLDIFAKSVEYLHVFRLPEHGESFGPTLPLAADWAPQLLDAVEIWRREKSLVLGAHVCVVNVEAQSHFSKEKIQRICAPLLLYSANLETNGSSYNLVIDRKSRRINYSLFDCFFSGREYQEQLEERFQGMEWNSTIPDIGDLFTHFGSAFKFTASDEVLIGADQVKHLAKALDPGHGVMMPGMVSALIMQSPATRGVLDELEQIAEAANCSEPLRALDSRNTKTRWRWHQLFKNRASPQHVPGSLSSAQQSALHAAVQHKLSVVIGPPGTGKSYTIAAMALERFMAQESVLIVAKSEHAVDVIRDKLVDELQLSASAIVRAGAKDYLKQLKQFVDALCHGVMNTPSQQNFGKQLAKISKKIKISERELKKEIATSETLDLQLATQLESGQQLGFMAARRAKQRLSSRHSSNLLAEKFVEIQTLTREREYILAQRINEVFTKKIDHLAKRHRQQLKIFRKALGARTSSNQDTLFSELNFSLLLKAMPVWICSLDSLYRALPLQPELFDLVIIDESTQCDIATCIPALYRARRAVIVGDPKQLRHFSFLSRMRQDALMHMHGLLGNDVPASYRDDSLLDLADHSLASQQQLTLLDEHYRSLPPIIEFSNREFYQSRLKIMTRQPGNASSRAIEIFPSDGKQIRGVNIGEAELLMQRLRLLIAEQAHIPESHRATIGVVSFFRAQAEYLDKCLQKEIAAEDLALHKLRAGTPYQFQGEERDIIFLTCAVDDKSATASMAWLNRADAFNVAITRAKSRQYIFISFNPAALNKKSYLARYLHNISIEKMEYLRDITFSNSAVKEFVDACVGLGLRCLPGYEIAGINMDFLLEFDGHALAVDLIGFLGGFHKALDFERYKLFERAGLPVYPVTFMEWHSNKTLVLKNLRSRVAEIRESSEVKRRSLGAFTHHWTKLLTVDYEFSKRVQALEGELLSLEESDLWECTGELIDAYLKLIWILSEILNERELTYSRYSTVAEMTLRQGIESLEKIVRLRRASTVTPTPHSQVANDIALLHEELRLGIRGLRELTLRWAGYNVNSDATGMRSVLTELERISERVNLYKD